MVIVIRFQRRQTVFLVKIFPYLLRFKIIFAMHFLPPMIFVYILIILYLNKVNVFLNLKIKLGKPSAQDKKWYVME